MPGEARAIYANLSSSGCLWKAITKKRLIMHISAMAILTLNRIPAHFNLRCGVISQGRGAAECRKHSNRCAGSLDTRFHARALVAGRGVESHGELDTGRP